jgi:hypothetical protein
MTKAQLRDHILRQLGVIGAVDTATAEDAELMETIIDNCHDELAQTDDIPAYAVEGLTSFCKASCQAWGQEYNPALREIGLRRLREVTADRRSGVGRAEYF